VVSGRYRGDRLIEICTLQSRHDRFDPPRTKDADEAVFEMVDVHPMRPDFVHMVVGVVIHHIGIGARDAAK
jgi:hypothetical protein